MSRRRRALAMAAACLVFAATSPVPPFTASAAHLAALPDTIRVNVAGLGTHYALIGSTDTLVVRDGADAELYRGRFSVVARRDVRRIDGRGGEALPDRRAPRDDARDEDRPSRVRMIREARRAAFEAGELSLVVVPFELAVLDGSAEGMGRVALSGDRVAPLRVTPEGGLLTFLGRVYRGTFEVTLDDEGDMIVVNVVRTSDYLASVVGAEVPPTWHPEALAAQAIAARTYLATHLRRHRAYDLEGDTRDQEYGGIGTVADSTVRAVERTAGVIATYRGGAIEALYSANAGGVTEDSENVYANALPYLRSVPSPADEIAANSSWGRTSWEWTREFTGPQLRDHLLVRGFDVGIPERIELLGTAPSGRVMRARVAGPKGSREIGKDASRYYFGLRSALFTVERKAGGELEVVDLINSDRTRELELLGAERLGGVYRRILGEERETLEVRITGSVFRLPDRFVFKGRGFGHGVGMSQWGAQGMAMQGRSAEEILAHYYRGIALTPLGGP